MVVLLLVRRFHVIACSRRVVNIFLRPESLRAELISAVNSTFSETHFGGWCAARPRCTHHLETRSVLNIDVG